MAVDTSNGDPLEARQAAARGVDLITRDGVAQRLAVAASSNAPAGGGAAASYISAAVLVPLINRPAGVTILFTQRSPHLNAHAGQISFPGGCVEAGDEDRAATALREAGEEIGLAHDAVSVLGALPDYEVPTGFVITPIVGWIEPPFTLRLQECEVAEVFEVPLEFFLDPGNHQRHSQLLKGASRDYWAIPFEGRHIWGATAAILVSLYEALRASAP